MKKVVLLAPTPPPVGGIAIWTKRMIESTLPNDWAIEVVDEKILGTREVFGDKTKLNIKNEIIRCLGIWNGLRIHLKDNNTKIVHACIAANTLPIIREIVSALITKIMRRKFIIHFRCTVPNVVSGRLNVLFLKVLCDLSDCIMLLNCQSDNYISSLTKTNTIIIPNFVSPEEIVKNHRINENIERVLYVGGIIESKGCLDIINAAKSAPSINFRLIGDSEEKCYSAAKEVPNVTIKGRMSHDQLLEEYKAADIFLFPSYFSGEGFSNSLLEAMAAGLPCIVTDWAANSDMISDGGGFVIDIKNSKQINQALDQMKSKKIREEQSNYNINKVVHEYSKDVILKKYCECYESLI